MLTGDVPMALRHGGNDRPLGRYLREVLRNEMGVPQSEKEAIKARFYAEKATEMRELLQASPLVGTADSMRDRLSAQHAQKAASLEARDHIMSSARRKL